MILSNSIVDEARYSADRDLGYRTKPVVAAAPTVIPVVATAPTVAPAAAPAAAPTAAPAEAVAAAGVGYSARAADRAARRRADTGNKLDRAVAHGRQYACESRAG